MEHYNRGQLLLDHMKHAVGWPKFYRNHFCVEIESVVEGDWFELVGLGLARATHVINEGRDRYFAVTDAGIAFLQALKP